MRQTAADMPKDASSISVEGESLLDKNHAKFLAECPLSSGSAKSDSKTIEPKTGTLEMTNPYLKSDDAASGAKNAVNVDVDPRTKTMTIYLNQPGDGLTQK